LLRTDKVLITTHLGFSPRFKLTKSTGGFNWIAVFI
jgi:hypothetical protein